MVGNGRSRSRRGWLPPEVTSFVGRQREVSEIRRLVAAARLVTLTGVGGVGKTRLAQRVAADLRRSFDDGVWQVDLAAVDDPALIEYAVAAVLDLQDQSGRPPVEIIVEYLRERRALLVIDNCEHLLDACARLVDRLLRAVPGVRVVCTSRQPLGMPGEHVWPVPPMSVPGPDEPVWPAVAAGRYEALELLCKRAAAAAPGFRLTAENLPTAVHICAALDGLPLAIELAAARLRTHSLDQLAAGLDNRFGLLSARHATPARHRGLHTTFEWSFALRSAAERALWLRAAVFSGSFTPEAAEYVCGDDDLSGDGMLGPLTGLVDKSVLLREEVCGQVRYRLLETVRQYGLHRLRAHDPGAEHALRIRHRDYYLGLAERYERDWFSTNQAATYLASRHEHANFRAALEHSLAHPDDAHTALHLAGTLWFYWNCCGYVVEGRHWLDRALAADAAPSPARAQALWTASVAAGSQGDTTTARRLTTACRAVIAPTDTRMLARVRHIEATTALFADDLPAAVAGYEQCLRGFAELGEVNSNVLLARAQLAMALTGRASATGPRRCAPRCWPARRSAASSGRWPGPTTSCRSCRSPPATRTGPSGTPRNPCGYTGSSTTAPPSRCSSNSWPSSPSRPARRAARRGRRGMAPPGPATLSLQAAQRPPRRLRGPRPRVNRRRRLRRRARPRLPAHVRRRHRLRPGRRRSDVRHQRPVAGR